MNILLMNCPAFSEENGEKFCNFFWLRTQINKLVTQYSQIRLIDNNETKI